MAYSYQKRFYPSQLQSKQLRAPFASSSCRTSISQSISLGQHSDPSSSNTAGNANEPVIPYAEVIAEGSAVTNCSQETTAQADLSITAAKEAFCAAPQAPFASRESTIKEQETALLAWVERLGFEEQQQLGLMKRGKEVKKREPGGADNESRPPELERRSVNSGTPNIPTVQATVMSTTEWESKLSIREKLVEDSERKVEHKEQELQREEERITQRMLRWEETWKKLSIKEQDLQSRHQKMQEHHRELEEREKLVVEREMELEGKVDAVRIREEELSEQINSLAENLRRLSVREKELQSMDHMVQKHHRGLEEREKRVFEWEIKAKDSSGAVRRREEELNKEAERALRQWEHESKEKTQKLEANWKRLGEQEKELKLKLERYEEDRKVLCQQQNELREQMRNSDEKTKTVCQQEKRRKQLTREQAVMKRESSVLKRETAVATREMEVAQREHMAIADRERVIAEERERVSVSDRQEHLSLTSQRVRTRPRNLDPRAFTLADFESSTTGICTPATMSVCIGSSDEINLHGGSLVDMSDIEED